MTHNTIKAYCVSKRTVPLEEHKRGMGNLLCPECCKRYANYSVLMRHLKSIHGLEKADKYRKQYEKQKNVLIAIDSKQKIISPPIRDKTIAKIEDIPKLTKITRLSFQNSEIPNNEIQTSIQTPIQNLNELQTKIVKKSKKSVKKLNSKQNRINIKAKIASISRRNANTDERKEWKCDYNRCERSYFDKHNLKRHQMEMHKKLSKNLFFNSFRAKGAEKVKYFCSKTTKIVESPAKVVEIKDNNNVINDNQLNVNDIQLDSCISSPNVNQKVFVCNYKNCSNSYISISGLYKHKKTKHKSKKSFSVIAKVGKKTSALIAAQNTRPAVPNNPTVSMKISKYFIILLFIYLNDFSNLLLSLGKPSLSRQYICEMAGCGGRYTAKSTLTAHMKEKHNILNHSSTQQNNGEEVKEKYDCPYNECLFQTAGRKSLVSHYKTHFGSEEKPFKCLITGCNYSNRMLNKLKNHVLNRHSEQQFFRAMELTGVHYPVWY